MTCLPVSLPISPSRQLCFGEPLRTHVHQRAVFARIGLDQLLDGFKSEERMLMQAMPMLNGALPHFAVTSLVQFLKIGSDITHFLVRVGP